MNLLQGAELRPEVTGDSGDLQREEGQRPVFSEGDRELHTSGIYPDRGRSRRELDEWWKTT